MSDYDSADDQGILKQALHVEFPDDFNPDSTPETGEEYLHHVIYERSKCQEWTRADVSFTSSLLDHCKFTIFQNEIDKVVSEFAPSPEWQEKKLSEFKEFSRYLALQECKGRSIKNLNMERFMERLMKGEMPAYYTLKRYTEHTKIDIIDSITEYLESLSGSYTVGKNVYVYVYSIMASVEDPYDSSICSSLRKMCRACKKLRRNLESDAKEDDYVPLNLIICLVGRYFKQFDLADGFE